MDAIRLLSVAIRAVGFMMCLQSVSSFIDFLLTFRSLEYEVSSGTGNWVQYNSHNIATMFLGLVTIVFADLFARLCFGQPRIKRIDLWGDGELKEDERTTE